MRVRLASEEAQAHPRNHLHAPVESTWFLIGDPGVGLATPSDTTWWAHDHQRTTRYTAVGELGLNEALFDGEFDEVGGAFRAERDVQL
jgi:hypothetical protein